MLTNDESGPMVTILDRYSYKWPRNLNELWLVSHNYLIFSNHGNELPGEKVKRQICGWHYIFKL